MSTTAMLGRKMGYRGRPEKREGGRPRAERALFSPIWSLILSGTPDSLSLKRLFEGLATVATPGSEEPIFFCFTYGMSGV